MVDVLFVCLGNICRSPVAEGVARVLEKDFPELGKIDSAGTGPWHVGNAPHSTMRKVARRHRVPLDDLRARQVENADFYDFDILIAMDGDNLRELQARQPADSSTRLVRLLDFSDLDLQDVPDPYYGGTDGFEDCFCIIRQGVHDFLKANF